MKMMIYWFIVSTINATETNKRSSSLINANLTTEKTKTRVWRNTICKLLYDTTRQVQRGLKSWRCDGVSARSSTRNHKQEYKRRNQNARVQILWRQYKGNWRHFSGRRPADMEWPPGRRDISRIIHHISSPPQDTPVREVFSWLLAGRQL